MTVQFCNPTTGATLPPNRINQYANTSPFPSQAPARCQATMSEATMPTVSAKLLRLFLLSRHHDPIAAHMSLAWHRDWSQKVLPEYPRRGFVIQCGYTSHQYIIIQRPAENLTVKLGCCETPICCATPTQNNMNTISMIEVRLLCTT